MEDYILASVFTGYAYDKLTPVLNKPMVYDDLH